MIREINHKHNEVYMYISVKKSTQNTEHHIRLQWWKQVNFFQKKISSTPEEWRKLCAGNCNNECLHFAYPT